MSAVVRHWLSDLLFQQDDQSDIESWTRNVRNWRRDNRTVTGGPADARGCRRITIEWDEDLAPFAAWLEEPGDRARPRA